MKRISIVQSRTVILLMVFCIALSPIAMQLHAQTPGAADPPPPAEVTPPPADDPPPPPAEEPPPPPVEEPPVADPPVQEPPADNPPVEEPPADNPPVEEPPVTEPPVGVPPADNPPADDSSQDGAATETPTSEATEEPGDGDTPTTEVKDASRPATPTPTEEVIVPDQLQVVGGVSVTIIPGEYRDVTIRYTIGSDREKTQMSANLTAPGGESLEGWSLVPWQRADLDEKPQNANRLIKARIDYPDSMENGDVYETTWRVTAPDHIENPITVRLHLSTRIHREDGVTDGVIKNDLVSFNATASVHNPTLACDEVIAEDVDNTWNCVLATTHPGNDVLVNAQAVLPAGWDLKVNNAQKLTDISAPLDGSIVASGAFTLAATYPIGCPDVGATFSASVHLSMTYASGEVSAVTADLPLVFERPNSTLEIASFEFAELDVLETLSTTGTLKLAYEEAPCAWQGTIEISDLHSDSLTVNNASIGIVKTEARPESTITISGGTINILMPESFTPETSGEITIHLQIDLTQQIPPGTYVISVVTQVYRLDEN